MCMCVYTHTRTHARALTVIFTDVIIIKINILSKYKKNTLYYKNNVILYILVKTNP